jgi:YfiH family protein
MPMMSMPGPQPNRGFEWTQAAWGPALRCASLAKIAPHYFTISNLALRDSLAEWNAVAAAMHVPAGGLRLIRQVHGASVAVARTGDPSPWETPEADAVVTDDPGVAIAVRVADCAPILLADRKQAVVGAAHAGWRGAVKSVASEAVCAMEREFGSLPSDLVAAIGPCLGPCCGEVGEEVIAAFRDAGHSEPALGRWFSPGPRGRPMLDLWTANVDQLIAAGVPPDSIHVSGLCTKTHAGIMHSYRVSGAAAGRMVGTIRARLKDEE